MNIPESWLRSFCDPALPGRELADKLTMAGIEVENYEPVGPQFSGVVVAEVMAVEKHPNADKLTVCKVKAGKDTLQVVCGAPNVRAGMKVPRKCLSPRSGRSFRGSKSRPRLSGGWKAKACCARRASLACPTITPDFWK